MVAGCSAAQPNFPLFCDGPRKADGFRPEIGTVFTF
jgi:hypothetical protein